MDVSNKSWMRPPNPLDYFASLVDTDEHLPLLEAATCLAQDEYPKLDVQQTLYTVDQLLARVKRRVPSDADGLQRLRVLNQFFYRELGFGGNLNNYYDPENSFVSTVLRTRRGIPVTLSVIWLELAQGLGLRARGVAFPGHFLVKVNLPKGQVVIDPITGQSLSREELVERLAPVQRDPHAARDFEVPLGLYLQAASERDILTRMLRNLKEIYRSQEDWPRLLPVLHRITTLVPQEWSEYRDRGLVHAELGNHRQAMVDLETYVVNARYEVDIGAIGERLAELRARAEGQTGGGK